MLASLSESAQLGGGGEGKGRSNGGAVPKRVEAALEAARLLPAGDSVGVELVVELSGDRAGDGD